MKNPLFLLLALSLAGNAVLGYLILRPDRTSSVDHRQTNPGETRLASADQPRTVAASPGAPASGEARKPAAPAPGSWQTLYAGHDLGALVTNLRRAGFPAAVVRAAVNHQLDERFADRQAAVIPPFWVRTGGSPEQIEAQLALNNERRELFESLLGADALPSAVLDPNARARRYGQLSDDKVNALAKIERDYGEVSRLAYSQRQANMFTSGEEMMKQQELVEQERRADLATVLSPEELEQFEMRNSITSGRLANSLRAVDVNEAEYAALYRMQKAADAANPARYGALTPEANLQRLAAQERLNEQARTVLNDDRFYKYLEAADSNYAQAARFTAAFPSIPPATTYELSKIQRELQTLLTRPSGQNQPPSPAERTELAKTVGAIERRVDALLGPEAAAAYKKQGMGRMFVSIRSAPGG